ncbi:MAG: LytTR family transcriptional regulator [Bacteroidales bacterium]|nr:LytTR family transcriptional regulator [Bacteroidales bacterium]
MDLNKRIPNYLLTKANTVKLIVFTAIFSLVFINVFKPYRSELWVPDMTDLRYFILSSILVLLGMAVVAISRVIMYKNYGAKGRRLMLWQYLIWIAVEILAMAISFTIFERAGFNDSRDLLDMISISLKNTAWILLLPYSALWLYFSWDDKNKKLQRIESGGMEVSKDTTKGSLMMANFYDNKGEIKFSVKLSDLMYIKGADNYIVVYYAEGQKLSSILIRNTMKHAEANLKPQGIIRCHKSYMVNSQHIKLLEKKNDGLLVKLDAPMPLSIPVTKSYVKDVYEML